MMARFAHESSSLDYIRSLNARQIVFSTFAHPRWANAVPCISEDVEKRANCDNNSGKLRKYETQSYLEINCRVPLQGVLSRFYSKPSGYDDPKRAVNLYLEHQLLHSLKSVVTFLKVSRQVAIFLSRLRYTFAW